MTLKINLLLSYNNFFEEEGKDKYDYLDALPSHELKLSGAMLVKISQPKSPFNDLKYFLKNVISKENKTFVEMIWDESVQLSKRYPGVLFLNPLTSLQIAEYSLIQKKENKVKLSNELFEQILIKAYLKFNTDNIRDDQIIKSIDLCNDNDKLAANTILSNIAYYDLTNYELFDIVRAQFIKSVYLFQFMEKTEIFQPIINKFLIYYSCKSWEEYLQKLLPFIFKSVANQNSTYTEFSVVKNEKYTESCTFIDMHIFDINDNFSRNLDFIILRGKPITKVEEGRYRVISDLFLAEKLYNSLYFTLSDINNKLTIDKKVKNFRGVFCHQYSENYLFYSAIRNIYGNKYLQLSGEEIVNKFRIDSEPDYYLRNGNKVFLFESKDVLLNAETKISYDFQKVEKALQDKFYYDDQAGKQTNKAVLQLINNIKNILSNNLVFDKYVKSKSAKIYPIIITYYNTFNTPGINYWINKWHFNEITKLNYNGFNTCNVRPITIINIDTLILYSDLIKNKTIELDTLIDEYHKLRNLKSKKAIILEDFTDKLMERFIPFDVYIHNYCNNRQLRVRPSLFMGEKMLKNAENNNSSNENAS